MDTLKRRMLTIPLVLAVAGLMFGLLPLLLLASLAVDLARGWRARSQAVTRLVLFGAGYLVGQVLGLVALFLAWVVAGFGSAQSQLLTSTYAIQRAWVAWNFGAVRRLFRLSFDFDGEETVALAPPGPLVVFMQHTSLVDTLLPTTFLTARHGLRLRWVLKRELLVDPCLDVAGHRLPNAFVARGGADTERAVAAVKALARDLGPADGVLIYPEGTRFTPARREAALAKLASEPARLARASRLRHVLPPRPGGPLALLEAAPEADILFLAHVGFEGLASVAAILSGDLVGRTVRLRAWRVARAEVPHDTSERRRWLEARWEALDAWVHAASGHDDGGRTAC